MKKNVIIYTRVSTDEQAEKGYSVRHQLEMLHRFSEMKEYNILKCYEEDFSAKNFNRPEWLKLEAYVKANKNKIDKILFTKWDRFSRNLEEALLVIKRFKKMGIELNAVEQPLDMMNPDNKTMLMLYLILPEVENDKISMRTKDGILRARKEGAYTSKPPFGFDGMRIDDKASMRPNKDAVIVKEMFGEVANGLLSIEQIRKDFIKKGYKGCKQSFYYMLRNKVYCGMINVPEHQKEPSYWVEGIHDPIIDEITFQRVQDVIDGKKKNTRYPAKRHELLPLRGFLKCPICNKNLTGSVSKGNGGKYAYYHCRNGCENRISSDLAHKIFSKSILSNIKINDNVLNLFKVIFSDAIRNKKGDKSNQLTEISTEISKLENQLNIIDDKWILDEVEPENYKRISSRYKDKIMELKAEYELIKNQKEEGAEYLAGAINALKNFKELFENGSYDMKILILGSILNDKVLISKTECRTIEMNKVVELISRFNNGFRVGRKEKTVISDGLSTVAPPAGLEPATL